MDQRQVDGAGWDPAGCGQGLYKIEMFTEMELDIPEGPESF
jgi:hypothetical protein